MTPGEALDLRFYCDDLDEIVTIREYFQQLLKTLFAEGEGFSGKRPFGNSGWEYDLHTPLVIGGAMPGTIEVRDEDGEELTIADYDVTKVASGEQSVEVEIDRKFNGYDDFVDDMIDAL